MADSDHLVEPSMDASPKSQVADIDTQISEEFSRKLLANSSLSSSCSSLHSNNSNTDHDALENSTTLSVKVSNPPLLKASPSDVLSSLGLPEVASTNALRSLAPAPFSTDAVAQQTRDECDFRFASIFHFI